MFKIATRLWQGTDLRTLSVGELRMMTYPDKRMTKVNASVFFMDKTFPDMTLAGVMDLDPEDIDRACISWLKARKIIED